MAWQLELVYYQLSKRLKYQEIIRYLRSRKYQNCLDIGTGTGGLAYLYRKHGQDWHYVETDVLVIKQAQSLLGNENIVTDFNQLGGRKFDFITMIDSFFYFEQPSELIDTLSTLLKLDGELLITATDGDPKRFINRLREKIGLGKSARGFTFEESPDKFLERLSQKNWQVIYFKTFSFVLAELLIILSDMLQRLTHSHAESVNHATSVLTNRLAVDRKKIWLLRLAFPVFYSLSLLDWPLRPFSRGYKFIVVAKPPTLGEL